MTKHAEETRATIARGPSRADLHAFMGAWEDRLIREGHGPWNFVALADAMLAEPNLLITETVIDASVLERLAAVVWAHENGTNRDPEIIYSWGRMRDERTVIIDLLASDLRAVVGAAIDAETGPRENSFGGRDAVPSRSSSREAELQREVDRLKAEVEHLRKKNSDMGWELYPDRMGQ